MNRKLDFEKIAQSPLWIIAVLLVIFCTLAIYGYHLPVNYAFPTDEGDFGRDLYCFELVSKGQLPYVDFHWIYGPLPVLLYGLCFKIFGATAFNALTLWYAFYIATIITIYFLVSDISHKFNGFLAAFIYILYFKCFHVPTFYITLAFFIIALTMFFLRKYYVSDNNKYLYITAGCLFLLAITKLHIGIYYSLAVISGFIIYLYLSKKDFKVIIKPAVSFMLSGLILYVILILLTPLDQLHLSFPYFDYVEVYSKAPIRTAKNICQAVLSAEGQLISTLYPKFYICYLLYVIYILVNMNLWYFFIAIAGVIAGIVFVKSKKLNNDAFFIITLTLMLLIIFPEFFYVRSSKILIYWALIPTVVLLFSLFSFNWPDINVQIKDKFKNILLAVIMLIVITANSLILFQPLKTSEWHYINHPKMRIYISNEQWLNNTKEILNYLEKPENKCDYLLSVPYAAIYNFLSNRKFPDRYIEFLIFNNYSTKDEQNIINSLNKTGTKHIILIPTEPIGNFGSTHCKKLMEYIENNYQIDKKYPVTNQIYYAKEKKYNDINIFIKQ